MSSSQPSEPPTLEDTAELQSEPITDLFRAAVNDDQAAHDLYLMVKVHFQSISRFYKRKHKAGDSLPTDDPVDESFAALLRRDPKLWNDREHITRVAAVAMQNVVRSHLRRKRADKRGLAMTLNLSGSDVPDPAWRNEAQSESDAELAHRLTHKLETAHPELATVIRLKHFGKMTYEQIAELKDKTRHQIEYAYRTALAWLIEHADVEE